MIIKKIANGMGSVRINTSAGDALLKELSKKYVARVGILGSKSARMATTEHTSKTGRTTHRASKTETSELTNAEIGLRNEKGVYSEGIPRRSFIEMPLVNNLGKNNAVAENVKSAFKGIEGGASAALSWKLAYKRLGIFAESIIQKAFELHGPGWRPNRPMTVALKGSDSPLIDTAQLRKSITSTVLERA